MFLTSMLRVLLTRSFKPFIFEGNFDNNLEFEDLDDLGLYVHIPFCRSICDFCPYCKEEYDEKRAADYKTALLKEIDIACRHMTGPKKATSLYFGGGTPALMIDGLEEIIGKLKRYFVISEGIGVELHPSDISDMNLKKLKSAGVNMVSLGIQSFDDDCLRKLGRSNDNFKEKLGMVNNYDFDAVDVDLIFAIPGQTSEILAKDIKTAFDNGATQVSTYPFIDFTFADNEYKPMPEKVKKRMLSDLVRSSAEMDMERTSVWTFAKRNTKKYSSVTRDTFLGFGVSATSLLKDSFKINTFSIDDYIKRVDAGLLPTSLTTSFTKRQRAVYYLFWGAYSMKIHLDKFEKIIGTPLNKMFGLEFFLAEKAGFCRRKGNRYEITDKAAYIYHYIEQVYTTSYIDKMWNISRKVAFPDRIVLK
ncbi:oxygen-independent coproporphyrinogen-3 oxidase [Dethiosulfatibacter aminovorans DSM 17477]|uniref:Heme chaperone HemW n=1 Tax=Dethiosulfatibacter aminovorans DSM 17477 TaxID=1121476 RepID=A0A1M6HPW4_9FIRM|nr:radical SAM protein [Dethiosulfatibacter aminovorans]SHJ24229.1 oxygen-independent coproporphyrinogen-3 oxidase [Dethiosulfatibacter aminovorans DSM 17477]